MKLNANRRVCVPGLHYVLAASLAIVSFGSSPIWGQACSGNSPAFVVDQDLWLTNFFRPGLTDLPGNRIPPERDSSDWGSLTIPGANSGHELFWAVDVLDDYLFVAYNAGIQVWDIQENGGALPRAEDPLRLTIKDGWRGEFLDFPPPGEDDLFLEDIDVIKGTGSTIYIAASGRFPVGINVWKFNTSNGFLTPLYQNSGRSSRQVRLVDTSATGNGSQIYALSSRENAVELYDVTRADVLDPCHDDESTTNIECPGVHLGKVRGSTTDLTAGGFLDVMQLPTGQVYFGVSDGTVASSLGFNLWQVNFSDPAESIRRFSGFETRTFGLAFFSQPSNLEGGTNYYLGAIERDGSDNWIRIFDVSNCLTSNCGTLPRVGQQISRPGSSARQFLTYSTSNGTPFLYYGLAAPSTAGPKTELLLDVSNINNIKEITEGGPTYFDICVNQDVGYWGWYYSMNEFGFGNFTPTIGKFHPTRNYFYRAAVGMLDVHVWEGGATVPVMNTALDPGQGTLWFEEPISFSASALNCPGAENWTWSDDDTIGSTIADNGNQADFTFATCGSSNECPSRDINVSAIKDACASDPNLIINSVQVSVNDPRAFIDGITVNPPGNTFPVCSVLTFNTNPNPPRGRAPFEYDWSVKNSTGDEVLAGTGSSLVWDTSLLEPQTDIFADGFESGDVSAWSSSSGTPFDSELPAAKRAPVAPRMSVLEMVNKTGGSVFTVDVDLSNQGGPVTDNESIQVTILPLGTLGFEVDPIIETDLGGGSFDLLANSENATEWKWEIEDPENGSTVGCQVYTNCFIIDWAPSNQVVSYQWQTPNVPGDYGVTVWIRNCEQFDNPLSAETTVTVTNLEIPVITKFRVPNNQIQPVDPTGPCKFFDVIDQILHCLVNEEIQFEIEADGNPSAYQFGWETGSDWGGAVPVAPTIAHTFSTTGAKSSAVRATTNIDEPFSLQQNLVIVNSLP